MSGSGISEGRGKGREGPGIYIQSRHPGRIGLRRGQQARRKRMRREERTCERSVVDDHADDGHNNGTVR